MSLYRLDTVKALDAFDSPVWTIVTVAVYVPAFIDDPTASVHVTLAVPAAGTFTVFC